MARQTVQVEKKGMENEDTSKDEPSMEGCKRRESREGVKRESGYQEEVSSSLSLAKDPGCAVNIEGGEEDQIT